MIVGNAVARTRTWRVNLAVLTLLVLVVMAVIG